MKTYIVITIAALCAAIGETLLSYGMRKYGAISLDKSSHLIVLISAVFRNPSVFAGVVFLGIFFFLYLAALSWADLSYVLPLTAMSYIFAAFLAKFVLGEDVSFFRWLGTIVIVIGIAFVVLDGQAVRTDPRENVHDEQGHDAHRDETVRG